MRILTRYILREVTSHALIGAAIFTFVLFTRDLGRILELVVRASAPLPSVAEIFFYTVPLALTYTIPMSVLVGILIGLSRLAADSEITAMRASGMGVWNFGRVLAIFVVAPGCWLWATDFTWPRTRLHPWDIWRINSKARKSLLKSSPEFFTKAFPRSCSMCRTYTARKEPRFGRVCFSPTSPIPPIRVSRWPMKASSSPRVRIACTCI
jgi:hypothetical protein